jgi:hypothetical protein
MKTYLFHCFLFVFQGFALQQTIPDEALQEKVMEAE